MHTFANDNGMEPDHHTPGFKTVFRLRFDVRFSLPKTKGGAGGEREQYNKIIRALIGTNATPCYSLHTSPNPNERLHVGASCVQERLDECAENKGRGAVEYCTSVDDVAGATQRWHGPTTSPMPGRFSENRRLFRSYFGITVKSGGTKRLRLQ